MEIIDSENIRKIRRKSYLSKEMFNHLLISSKLNNWIILIINEERGIIPNMEEYAKILADYVENLAYGKYRNKNKFDIEIDESIFSDIGFKFFEKAIITFHIEIDDNKKYTYGESDFTDWTYYKNVELLPWLSTEFTLICGRNDLYKYVMDLVYHEFTHVYSDLKMFKKSGKSLGDKLEKTNYFKNSNRNRNDIVENDIGYFFYATHKDEMNAYISQIYSELMNEKIYELKTIEEIIEKVEKTNTYKVINSVYEILMNLNNYTEEMKEKALEYWNSISYIKIKNFDYLKRKMWSRFFAYKKKMIDGIFRNIETIFSKNRKWKSDSLDMNFSRKNFLDK